MVVGVTSYGCNSVRGVFTVSYPRPAQLVLASLAASPRCGDEGKPALAALHERATGNKEKVRCPGHFTMGNKTWRCHKDSGHGMLFKSFDGRLMLVLHQPFRQARGKLFEMEDTGDTVRVKRQIVF